MKREEFTGFQAVLSVFKVFECKPRLYLLYGVVLFSTLHLVSQYSGCIQLYFRRSFVPYSGSNGGQLQHDNESPFGYLHDWNGLTRKRLSKHEGIKIPDELTISSDTAEQSAIAVNAALHSRLNLSIRSTVPGLDAFLPQLEARKMNEVPYLTSDRVLNTAYNHRIPSEYLQGIEKLPSDLYTKEPYKQLSPQTWNSVEFDRVMKEQNKTRVCFFSRTDRQDSLFRLNLFMRFSAASFKFYFKIIRATDCQHAGTCRTGAVSRFHQLCDSSEPTVRHLERIKNFQHDRFDQNLVHGLEDFDLMLITGDEFCRAETATRRAHFRTYFGKGLTQLTNPQAPIYLPLGPRSEFERVSGEETQVAHERKYLFNFMGSLSSDARVKLRAMLLEESNGRYLNQASHDATKDHTDQNKHQPQCFIHTADKWQKKLVEKNGYLTPDVYRAVVLRSVFTLCPQGHNPEAFRIFEAAEAGSIPILVLDKDYLSHECQGSYLPLLLSKAPFVFLNSWSELPSYLENFNSYSSDQATQQKLAEMQLRVKLWYRDFLLRTGQAIEDVLEGRWKQRLRTGGFELDPTLLRRISHKHDLL